MTDARNHHLFLYEPTFYHLMSRCVRRAFLCGKDKFTRKRYDHRKRWLEKRLFELSELFFIDLYGYAIMSNHYHLVIQTRPDEMLNASDEQIAQRWGRLFPHRSMSEQQRIQSLCQNSQKLALYRTRLCDISWLMRCLNEGLARKANKEDACSGRFWQGRFRSQLLLDEAAVYTCMAYVDLNPIRAGITDVPEQSKLTSIRYRLTNHSLNSELTALNTRTNKLTLSLKEYLELLDESGRYIRNEYSGYIDKSVKPVLARIGISEKGYKKVISNLHGLFYRAVGSESKLKQLSQSLEQSWVKGQSVAKHIFN